MKRSRIEVILEHTALEIRRVRDEISSAYDIGLEEKYNYTIETTVISRHMGQDPKKIDLRLTESECIRIIADVKSFLKQLDI